MLRLVKKENTIHLQAEIYLINKSNTNVNLFVLATAIKKQIENVYNNSFEDVRMTSELIVMPLYKHDLKVLYNKPVIAISSAITNNNVAEADFGGQLIKLNPKIIDTIISGANKRTVPHEFGHLLGLDHPHANAQFESVNLKASLYEQQITNKEKTHNLMCQGWYIQKAGIHLNDALQLTNKQVKLIYENFASGKLNNNYSIKRGLFNYKWVGNI